MTAFFLDTSALSKRYVQENGTEWLRALVAPEAGNTVILARIAMVELYSALARRRREGIVSEGAYVTVEQAFAAHVAGEYEFVELDLQVIAQAHELLERNPLRAYDAAQLASAVLANNALLTAQLTPLVFVFGDDRLNGIAAAEGLVVENPNRHLVSPESNA
jgi:uncharacterized protein